MVTCRHLYKSPCCGRRFLWPRPFGSLSLCLLEAVLAHLEEQGSVGAGGKWPACGLPRGASVQLPAAHGVQRWGVGEEVPAGGEGQRAELRQAPGGGHEDQPDVSGHPRRGADGAEGEAQPAGQDSEADHRAHLLLQVPHQSTHAHTCAHTQTCRMHLTAQLQRF